MVETIGFPVTANQSSAGDYLPIDSDTLAGCTVTNSSAYAVEYSTGGAWTTIAAGGSATINTDVIATTSLRFRKKTGDSIPVVLSVAVTHPGTIPAQIAMDAGGNVIGLNNPSSGGLIPLSTVVNQFYHFHGFAGNQFAGDPKFFDFAAGNHGVFGANLSSAQAFANAGYVSTVDPAIGVTDSVIRIPSLNFDYSGGEKLIIWWLGAATPEGADVTLMGDGSNTTAGNQGVRIRMTTAGKLSNVLYGQGNSAFSGTTTGVPFDGSLHSFSVMFDGATKKYGMWVDDVLDASIPNSYAQLASGVDVDTRTTNTFNIGAASRSPGGTEGSAVKTRALVILRLPADKSVPLASELTSLFTALRANAGKPIAYGAI